MTRFQTQTGNIDAGANGNHFSQSPEAKVGNADVAKVDSIEHEVTVTEDYEGWVINVTIGGTAFRAIMHTDDAKRILADGNGFYRKTVTSVELGKLREMLQVDADEVAKARIRGKKISMAEDQILLNLRKPREDSESVIRYWEGELDKLGEDGKRFTAEQRHGLHIAWEDKMEGDD